MSQTRSTRWTLRSLAPFLAVAALGCSDSTGPGGNGGNGGNGNEPLTGTIEVTLQGTSFSPRNPTIKAGSTIRWVNQETVTHTVTPDGHSQWSSWSTSNSGETFEHTFNATGTFNYFCQPHQSQGMTGSIIVVP